MAEEGTSGPKTHPRYLCADFQTGSDMRESLRSPSAAIHCHDFRPHIRIHCQCPDKLLFLQSTQEGGSAVDAHTPLIGYRVHCERRMYGVLRAKSMVHASCPVDTLRVQCLIFFIFLSQINILHYCSMCAVSPYPMLISLYRSLCDSLRSISSTAAGPYPGLKFYIDDYFSLVLAAIRT